LVTGSVQKSNAMPELQYFNDLEDSDNNNNIKYVSAQQQQISSNVKKFIIDQILNKSKIGNCDWIYRNKWDYYIQFW
jgi:hypothetical protein